MNVVGSGYTDHCPECLWSKHVDVNPGDRQANCGGLMEPVVVEWQSDRKTICYQCRKCDFRHRVKAALDDNFETMLKLTGEGK